MQSEVDKVTRGYKKFLMLWGASLISTSGSGMTSFALGIFIYQKTGMTSMTGLMIMAGFSTRSFIIPLCWSLGRPS